MDGWTWASASTRSSPSRTKAAKIEIEQIGQTIATNFRDMSDRLLDGVARDRTPADFAVAAEQAASARAASITSAHTARQIVSIVTVLAADQPAAVAVALAVVSDALRRPVASSIR